MKHLLHLLLPCLLVPFSIARAADAGPTILYVSESGEKRIAIYSMDEATGELTRTGAVDLPGAPGSLSIDPKRAHLYAAVRSDKQFATLTIDPATGALSEPVFSPAGIDAAYVQVDATGKWLLGASYSEGVVTVNRITDGVLTGAPIQTVATGRKAHCVQFAPGNRFAFVPHVGELNKVEQFRFDATTGMLSSNMPPYMPGGEGQGPRHMQFHPNGRWAYLVNEQGQSVTLCDYDANAGTLKIRQTASTTPETWDKSKGSCADIHISNDGRFAYASNRGHDSLTVFAIHADTGELKSLGQTPTEKTPRSFCLMPGGEKYVVAAGQGSNQLIVYRRDAGTGALTPLKTYGCGKSPAWVTGVKF
jgi:6-phosphogluconolactonase